MLDWLISTAGLFVFLSTIFVLQIALSYWAPSIFSRTGVKYSKGKGFRELQSRFEMHAFATSSAVLLSIFLILRDGFHVKILYTLILIPTVALLEFGNNIITWDRKYIIQRRPIFKDRKINWDEITALDIGKSLDGIIFYDGRTRIKFKARFAISQYGEMYEPPKDTAFGVLALARYAQMRLRNKPGVNWRAS